MKLKKRWAFLSKYPPSIHVYSCTFLYNYESQNTKKYIQKLFTKDQISDRLQSVLNLLSKPIKKEELNEITITHNNNYTNTKKIYTNNFGTLF
ncbi:hypothetical protein [Mycoplasma zalophi]|uniref:hypothetical protein n=1 Tax=Mycoplasma zalophi TaxID=191287 RepID=UPI001C101BEA|nr:hypothetical protein [Mycoplasma zalophi]MBU4690843.1 hypothetical protein [Mycoplasma zalophi]